MRLTVTTSNMRRDTTLDVSDRTVINIMNTENRLNPQSSHSFTADSSETTVRWDVTSQSTAALPPHCLLIALGTLYINSSNTIHCWSCSLLSTLSHVHRPEQEDFFLKQMCFWRSNSEAHSKLWLWGWNRRLDCLWVFSEARSLTMCCDWDPEPPSLWKVTKRSFLLKITSHSHCQSTARTTCCNTPVLCCQFTFSQIQKLYVLKICSLFFPRQPQKFDIFSPWSRKIICTEHESTEHIRKPVYFSFARDETKAVTVIIMKSLIGLLKLNRKCLSGCALLDRRQIFVFTYSYKYVTNNY